MKNFLLALLLICVSFSLFAGEDFYGKAMVLMEYKITPDKGTPLNVTSKDGNHFIAAQKGGSRGPFVLAARLGKILEKPRTFTQAFETDIPCRVHVELYASAPAKNPVWSGMTISVNDKVLTGADVKIKHIQYAPTKKKKTGQNSGNQTAPKENKDEFVVDFSTRAEFNFSIKPGDKVTISITGRTF